MKKTPSKYYFLTAKWPKQLKQKNSCSIMFQNTYCVWNWEIDLVETNSLLSWHIANVFVFHPLTTLAVFEEFCQILNFCLIHISIIHFIIGFLMHKDFCLFRKETLFACQNLMHSFIKKNYIPRNYGQKLAFLAIVISNSPEIGIHRWRS